MQRLIVLAIAVASCGYPPLSEIGGDAGVQGSDGGNPDGSGISVAPPTDLAYSDSSPTYWVGSAITPDVPTSSGGAVTSYSVSPALPDGLSLDPSTGIIAGTPTTASAASAYVVTARNSGGSTTADLVITVDIAAPMNLSYVANPVIYNVGIPINSNEPSASGGPIASYAVSPALPVGLSLDTSTGVISGTPTGETSTQSYTITAINAGGSASVDLSISVGLAGHVAMGGYHTCVLAAGGIWCWGLNSSGQLGDGSGSNSSVRVQVVGLGSGVQAVSGGQSHTCAIENGGAWCWGNNGNGQLGNTGSNSSVPVQVPGLGSGVQAIAASEQHTCALVNGGVWCWGGNYHEQLGNGSAAGIGSAVPAPVLGLGSGVQAIAAGEYHTCAVTNAGAVWCWGANNAGQLGNNSQTNEPAPVEVFGLTSGAEAIAAGANHTCAIVNGGVECWGDNQAGEIGSANPSLIPVPVSGLTSGVTAIAADQYHTCALVNGGVKCWGENTYGELGTGSAGADSSSPVDVSGLTSGVQALGVGAMGDFTCVQVGNSFKCWGWDDQGQLGNGSSGSYTATPVFVSGLNTGFAD